MKKFYDWSNIDKNNIPDELKSFVKDEMTTDDIKLLGNMIIKMQKERFKNKLLGWFYKRKSKKEDR